MTHRQQEILNAALDIIDGRGIQSLTIRRLAERLSLSEGAIYRHFESKQAIMAAAADLFHASSTDILTTLVKSERDSLNLVRQFFLGRCRQFSGNRALALVMFSDEIFRGERQLQANAMRTIDTHRDLLLRAFTKGSEEGRFQKADPGHLFLVVMGALRLLVTRWRGAGFAFDLEREGARLWETLEKLLVQSKE